ncbi:MAG TPA: TGS domain-containing protein [Pseudoxanthomonas sp.]|nr:TGS domain-containing protein [Pseudoxanthomonas sp.]
MSRPAIDGLHALLQGPAAAPLPPALRGSLLRAWDAEGADRTQRESWAVMADTLQALARLGADEPALAAALLFDLPGLRAAAVAEVAAAYPAVPGLLDGQDAADQVWALHAGREAGRNGEGLRRLLLAIVQDLRVVPVLLARQLARMRVADRQPEAARRALAQLTRDIHAPLANRLGIWQLKWELEDLAFRYLEPDTYRRIARELDETRTGRERYIEAVKAQLGKALAAQGLEAEISGRPKHIYSIWRKMQKKSLPIDKLYDLRAVRVMVGDVAACYAALGVVHALWAPVPGEFDDYIARPKPNGYSSLHTAVIGPEGRTLEVQIRTREMHEQAELGVAAHWRYKEGGKGAGKAFERKIAWMRQLLEQAGEGRDAEGLAGALDAELVEERVYALTPRGEVMDLPQGATPLDFAYHVHTMVGHRCRGAKVNGRIVPLTHRLRSGDRVEILTAKEPDPRRDWLLPANGYLASGRSRDKVRAWFHKLDRARNVQAGRELLERELKRLGLQHADLAPVARKFHAESVDDLYIQVALGDVGPHQVGRALHELERAAAQPQRVLPVEWGAAGGGYEVDVAVSGIDRKWLLKDVTTLIAQEDAHVADIRSDLRGDGRVQLRMRLRVSDYGQLSTLLGKLDALPGVERAQRLG